MRAIIFWFQLVLTSLATGTRTRSLPDNCRSKSTRRTPCRRASSSCSRIPSTLRRESCERSRWPGRLSTSGSEWHRYSLLRASADNSRSSRASTLVQETWGAMGQMMRSVAPTTEWTAFASRSEYLLDPDTPLRNPMTINYPGKDDPSVIEVHSGILERKKRFTKTYRESFYCLTPSGWMHQLSVSSFRFQGLCSCPRFAAPRPTLPSTRTRSSRSSFPNALSARLPARTLDRTSSTSKERRDWEEISDRRMDSSPATSTLRSERALTTRCSSGGTIANSSARFTVSSPRCLYQHIALTRCAPSHLLGAVRSIWTGPCRRSSRRICF